ncbi:hypothetical protein NMG60_11025891 [Bertholletia excelsa]
MPLQFGLSLVHKFASNSCSCMSEAATHEVLEPHRCAPCNLPTLMHFATGLRYASAEPFIFLPPLVGISIVKDGRLPLRARFCVFPCWIFFGPHRKQNCFTRIYYPQLIWSRLVLYAVLDALKLVELFK